MGAFLPHKNGAQKTLPTVKVAPCAIYTRKSTDENLDGYNSLHAQRDACLAFIQSREGMGWKPYSADYDDAGFSGKNMDRPALARLIEDAKKRRFSVVVCYKYDRLSRNTRDFLYLLDLFDRYGISFVSITQNIDTSTSSGRLLRQILVDFGQFEREMISERTRDKMAAMAAKGKWVGSHPQLGYDYNRDTKRLDLNEEEARQIRDIYEMYIVKRSILFTAEAAREKGYRMKSWFSHKSKKQKGGGVIYKTNLQRLLTNPIYLGKIHYKGKLYDGEHPPILDEDKFYLVQNMLYENRHGVSHRTKTKNKEHVFLLRKLIRCTACGYAMVPNYAYSRDKTYFYYKCVPIMKGRNDGCPVKRVPTKEIDQFILSRLKQLANHPQIVEEIVRKANDKSKELLPKKTEDRAFLARELGKIELGASNMVKMIADAETSNSPATVFYRVELDKLARKREELQSKLLKLSNEIQQLEEQKFSAEVIHANLYSFDQMLGNMDPHTREQLIQLVIERVDYDGLNRKVTINYFALSLMDRDLWKKYEAHSLCGPIGVIDGT